MGGFLRTPHGKRQVATHANNGSPSAVQGQSSRVAIPNSSRPLIVAQKRKRPNTLLDLADRQANASSNGSDTSKPTAVYTPTKGRSHTLSIALPGSIIAKYGF